MRPLTSLVLESLERGRGGNLKGFMKAMSDKWSLPIPPDCAKKQTRPWVRADAHTVSWNGLEESAGSPDDDARGSTSLKVPGHAE